MLYFKQDGSAVPWNGEPINEIRYPRNIENLWSATQLAQLGLYAPLPGPSTPAGHRISSRYVQIISGKVRWVYEFEPIPDPAPADVNLSMRQLRLGLVYGGFPVTFIQDTINQISDDTARAVATIWFEETSEVQWDHPMTQQLIAASGLSPELAASMWMSASDLPA